MLADLIQDLQDDFLGSDGSSLLLEAHATRMVQRALPLLNMDLGTAYVLDTEGGVSNLTDAHRELWLMRAKIMACEVLMARSAGNHSWKSGDKAADRHYEADRWKDLAARLQADYRARVEVENPSSDPDRVIVSQLSSFAERGSLGCYDPDPSRAICGRTKW